MKPHIGLVSAYAPLEVGWKEAPKLLREAKQRFSKLGLKVTAVNKPVFDLATGAKAAELFRKADVDVIVWVAATWSFDHVPVDVASRVGVPLVAWGIPGVETGSLCGSQQLVSVLTEIKHRHSVKKGRVAPDAVREAPTLIRVRRRGNQGHRQQHDHR